MRILLADDHRMMRDGLRSILEQEGMEVVAEAATGRETISLFHQMHPDLVVMDVSMPELNGVDATRHLVAHHPSAKIIALSMNADRRYVVAMFGAGASAYLVKNSAASELVRAIREVAAGGKYVSPAIAGVVLDGLPGGAAPAPNTAPASTGPVRPLSTREREVLQLLAEGASSKEIATRLLIAVGTVETHRRQIMDKLGLRTVAELTKYAIREGLTTL